MTIYADYQYYTDVFKGTIIPDEKAFDPIVIQASFKLNALTVGRINEKWAQDDRIKMACCAICDILYSSKSAAESSGTIPGRTITVQVTGRHHVSYGDSETYSIESHIRNTVAPYLWDTGLLNRAVRL